jgi:probable HAF family extracellular repeat protein
MQTKEGASMSMLRPKVRWSGRYVLLLLVLAWSTPAQADAIYHVTDLGSLSPVGLDNQGQVYMNRTYWASPDASIGAVRYDSYGPTAGQYINPQNNQPIAPPAHESDITGTAEVKSVNLNGQALLLDGSGAYFTNGTSTTPAPMPPQTATQVPFQPVGLTPSGQVVWDVWVPSQYGWQDHTMLTNGKNLVDLGTLGELRAAPVAVSSSGAVTGNLWSNWSSLNGGSHAFLYQNGKMIDLGTLGGDRSYAMAVNDHGQVVGTSGTVHDVTVGNGIYTVDGDNTAHAFLYSNGQMKDLGVLPGTGTSTGKGINDQGQVVGMSGDSPSGPGSYGFLYNGKTMLNLNNLLDPNSHFTITNAIAINDSGQILAQGYNGIEQNLRTLLLTPDTMALPPDPPYHLPEPSVVWLFGLAAAGMGRRRLAARK